jgi:hypothetical protein
MDRPAAPAPPTGFNERRSSPRFSANLVADCHQIAAKGVARWKARAADVSRGGVRLETWRHLDPGASLFIRFRSRDRRTWLMLPVQVVNASEGQVAMFAAGCRFAIQLTDSLVQAVLACG